jgi:putative methylase
MNTKKQLSIELSKLEVFEKPSTRLEQYPTDSNVAGDLLWNGYQLGDIAGKTVMDLGSGTGILGIGALILGAKKVIFVEIDAKAVAVLKRNLELYDLEEDMYEVVISNIQKIDIKVDTIFQNPPFGVQIKHADIPFLEKALTCADVIYSLHLGKSEDYLVKKIRKLGGNVSFKFYYQFPIKNTQKYHKKKIHYTDVIGFRIVMGTK